MGRRWVDRSWHAVHPWASGMVYPNYPDADLTDWDRAYHGDNLPRLMCVKARYDPDGVCRFARQEGSAMTPRELFDRNIAAFNAHDPATFGRQYDDAAVLHDPQYPEPLTGRANIEKDVAAFFTAFPDLHATVQNVMVDGATVAGELLVTGTHQGPLATPNGDIPATGNQATTRFATFATAGPDGTWVEERRYYDLAGMLAQLGLTG